MNVIICFSCIHPKILSFTTKNTKKVRAKTAKAPAVNSQTMGGKARTMLPKGGSGRIQVLIRLSLKLNQHMLHQSKASEDFVAQLEVSQQELGIQ